MDKDNMTNWIIIAAVAVVLILGGWWLMQRNSEESPAVGDDSSMQGDDSSMQGDDMSGGTMDNTSGTSTTGGTQPTTTSAQGETVSVNDQSAGTTVDIASMHISRETWVAVRDERSILGAGRFAAGTTKGTIELLRGTEPGKTYNVVLYIDNGNRAFDLTGDELVSGVSDTFTATDESSTGQ